MHPAIEPDGRGTGSYRRTSTVPDGPALPGRGCRPSGGWDRTSPVRITGVPARCAAAAWPPAM